MSYITVSHRCFDHAEREPFNTFADDDSVLYLHQNFNSMTYSFLYSGICTLTSASTSFITFHGAEPWLYTAEPCHYSWA